MNENDNHESEETVSLPSQAPKLDPLVLVGVVGLVFLAVFVVLTLSSKMNDDRAVEIPESTVVIENTPETNPDEPERTESLNDLPENFPVELILEENIVVAEGYTLTYAENDQQTVIFLSKKTVRENFEAYQAYLQKNAWVVMNTSEGLEVSSIYALKGGRDFNFTVSQSNEDEGAMVTLSIINR